MNENEKAMSKALDAIQDEAAKLLRFKLPADAEVHLSEIIALARYKFDVRPNQEKSRRVDHK